MSTELQIVEERRQLKLCLAAQTVETERLRTKLQFIKDAQSSKFQILQWQQAQEQ